MKLVACLALFVTLWVPAANANVCFMVYQMADNNLESYIRNDNYEMSVSEATRDPSLTTWIYFDHRNYGKGWEDISEPLQNVFNADGTAITGEKITGSQYIRWDHDLAKMVVDQTLDGEKDGDSPDTVSNFVETALTDCVAKSATEYFLVFSSHGSGYSGFGGDEHRGSRRLAAPQSNQSIISALKTALANVDGAPDMFDVIGFDACLMQAIGAADEYREVAKYFLASEAVEPGHGWAYDSVTNTATALDLAKDLASTFLSSTQGERNHQTPKTIAVVDLAKFSIFLTAWDDLSVQMEALLNSKDPDFFTQVNRARSQAIAFEGALDPYDAKDPSATDIGSYMQILQNGCVPALGSNLRNALQTAMDAYADMFVFQGNGQGTPAGTGMHVTFPLRQQYLGDPRYDLVLFDTDFPLATADAPGWLSFLKTYYDTTTPPEEGFSICTLGIGASTAPGENELLINPGVSNPTESGGHDIQTEVDRAVDSVFVEYGVDLTPIMEKIPILQKRRLLSTGGHPYHPRASRHRRAHGSLTSRSQRRLQSSAADYFILFGGDIAGTFNQSIYSAFWDRNFYYAQDDSGSSDVLYAIDNGAGAKAIPVIWLSPDNATITSEEIAQMPIGMTEQEFTNATGGQYGYLSLSTENAEDGVVKDGISLFTFNGETYGETSRLAGGQIVPVLYTEGTIDGVVIDTLVGGFNATVFDWNNDASLMVRIEDADIQLDQLDLETLIVDILAYDDDVLLQDDDMNAGVDFATFEIARDGTVRYYGDNSAGGSFGSLVGTLCMAVLTVLLFGMD